jgi:malate dehydrogenase (oxaloacetate-decarboxylating)
MLVEEVMTRNIISIDSKKSVFDSCKQLSKNKVGSLVVMDNDIPVGIITEKDLIEKLIMQNRDPKKTKVTEIMTSNIKTIHALAPIEKAVKMMEENKIKKLPVILNNEIVGIITETDMTKTIEAFSEILQEMKTFYTESRNSMEKMMDDWRRIIEKYSK